MKKYAELEIVSLISKLLSLPLGDQVYADDIRTLLDLLKYQTYPPHICIDYSYPDKDVTVKASKVLRELKNFKKKLNS